MTQFLPLLAFSIATCTIDTARLTDKNGNPYNLPLRPGTLIQAPITVAVTVSSDVTGVSGSVCGVDPSGMPVTRPPDLGYPQVSGQTWTFKWSNPPVGKDFIQFDLSNSAGWCNEVIFRVEIQSSSGGTPMSAHGLGGVTARAVVTDAAGVLACCSEPAPAAACDCRRRIFRRRM